MFSVLRLSYENAKCAGRFVQGGKTSPVMPGLVPGIHAVTAPDFFGSLAERRRVDGRDKPGHDALSYDRAISDTASA
jgi:hypothetical protein